MRTREMGVDMKNEHFEHAMPVPAMGAPGAVETCRGCGGDGYRFTHDEEPCPACGGSGIAPHCGKTSSEHCTIPAHRGKCLTHRPIGGGL